MGNRKQESPSCCSPPPPAGSSPTPSSGRPDPLGASTRTIGTIPASPPSKIPNLEGDSSLQVRPRPEKIENEKKDSIFENDPPAPPSPNQTRYPRLDRGLLGPGIDHVDAFMRAIREIMDNLAAGGTDVERVKREVGVSDELLRRYNYCTNLEEYRENNRRIAAPLFQPCVAKLNQTTNQADDLELLDVLFVEDDKPHGVTRVHMHFWAMRKSKAATGHESPGLYCAVLYPLGVGECECHVVGCVLLENYCPASGSNPETLGNCLNAARRNAKTLGELLALPKEVDFKEIKRRVRELQMKTGEMDQMRKIGERFREEMNQMRKIKEEMGRCLTQEPSVD